MEYLYIAAPIVTLVIGYFTGRSRAKVIVEEVQVVSYVDREGAPAPLPPGHKHEAITANPGGWFCECGLHKHIYVFAIPGLTDRRCQCGAIGTGKEWS